MDDMIINSKIHGCGKEFLVGRLVCSWEGMRWDGMDGAQGILIPIRHILNLNPAKSESKTNIRLGSQVYRVMHMTTNAFNNTARRVKSRCVNTYAYDLTPSRMDGHTYDQPQLQTCVHNTL